MDEQELLECAKQAREKAYVPYSRFAVGAAVETKAGNIYAGCNIENAAYPTTCCAERVAIFNAVSAGEKDFRALAVIADTDQPVSPCGSCRQVMSEFFSPETKIILGHLKGEKRVVTIKDLLPFSFGSEDLT